jgi:hypothetical protein
VVSDPPTCYGRSTAGHNRRSARLVEYGCRKSSKLGERELTPRCRVALLLATVCVVATACRPASVAPFIGATPRCYRLAVGPWAGLHAVRTLARITLVVAEGEEGRFDIRTSGSGSGWTTTRTTSGYSIDAEA